MMALEDNISAELDKVICRLMKLTIKNSTPAPPPTKWIQCKLLDLLNLAEKAVERRNARYIENYAFSDDVERNPKCLLCLDNNAQQIVERYSDLVQPESCETNVVLKRDNCEFNAVDEVLDIDTSLSKFSSLDTVKTFEKNFEYSEIISKLESHTTCLRDDLLYGYITDVFPESKISKNLEPFNKTELNVTKTDSRKFFDSLANKVSNNHLKTIVQKKSIKNFVKRHKNQIISEYSSYSLSTKKSVRPIKKKQIQTSTPIPETYYEIFATQTNSDKESVDLELMIEKSINMYTDNNISETKDSVIIEIVTEDKTETVAMRRTIGTDVDDESVEKELESYCLRRNDSYCNTFDVDDGIPSETIFLNDIYEPSTSKGIRHVGLDVQCGPDFSQADFSMSRNNSLTKIADCTQYDKSLHSSICHNNSFNVSSATESKGLNAVSPTAVGIKIKDSDTLLNNTVETMDKKTLDSNETETLDESMISVNGEETKMLKKISSQIRKEDSGSENTVCIMNWAVCHAEKISCQDAEVESVPSTKRIRSKLSCGTVHVHSYRNRQDNEDVMYQGEWQRHSPTPSIRMKNQEKKITNKITESRIHYKSKSSASNKKQIQNTHEAAQLGQKSFGNENKIDILKKDQTLAKNKRKTNLERNKVNKLLKPKSSLSKVSSKINITPSLPKNKRKMYNPASALDKPMNGKHQIQRGRVPKYLKRIKQEIDQEKYLLDESIGSDKTVILNKEQFEKNISNTILNENVLPEKELFQLSEILKDKKETRSQIDKLIDDEYQLTKDIKSTFLKYIEPNINYFVFRNEIENKSCSTECESDSKSKEDKKNSNRIPSPCSINSSTCSSPDSIATVVASSVIPVSARIKKPNLTKKLHSSYSKESDTPKNKKFIKKIKLCKKFTDDKNVEDKENIPESSKMSRLTKKIIDKFAKSSVTEDSKKEFSPHVRKENSNIQVRNEKFPAQNIKKCNLPIDKVDIVNDDSHIASVSPIESEKITKSVSVKSNINVQVSNHQCSKPPEIASESIEEKSDLDLQVSNSILQTQPSNNYNTGKIEDRESIMNWMTNSMKSAMPSPVDSSWLNDIHNENLEFVEVPSMAEAQNGSQKDPSSIKSKDFSSVSDDPQNVLTPSDELLQQAYDCGLISSEILNCSKNCPSNTRSSVCETDITSYKSLTSGFSDYAIAENEPLSQPATTSIVTSIPVRDIYERKDLNEVNLCIPVGSLALQAFSGFSMNAEPVVGDTADPVNLIDSETGSRAFEFRQATSEEVFVSERSEDSFETCTLEEDIVVPEWLFQIISQQQDVNATDEDEPDVPVAEPEFDLNGNAMDPPRAAAGAGDGRGVHSDLSQDSSGRGSSLTTTDSQSDPQSEAVELDLSTSEVSQRTNGIPISLPTILIDSPDLFSSIRIDSEVADFNEGVNRSLLTSDGDADVSSVDTIDTTDSELL